MRVPRKAISKTLPGNGPGLFLPLWLAAASAHFWWSEPAADEIAGAFAEAQKRTDSVRGMIADEPDIATDAYVRLGLATVKRFTHPIPGGPAGKETDWARLQHEEVVQVLDWTERRIASLRGGASVVVVPRLLHIRGGRVDE